MTNDINDLANDNPDVINTHAEAEAEEKAKAEVKSAESPDTPVADPNAGAPPAGYDEKGQELPKGGLPLEEDPNHGEPAGDDGE